MANGHSSSRSIPISVGWPLEFFPPAGQLTAERDIGTHVPNRFR
jgi:hypothetical protein